VLATSATNLKQTPPYLVYGAKTAYMVWDVIFCKASNGLFMIELRTWNVESTVVDCYPSH